MHHVNHTNEGCRTVRDRRRTAHDFNAFDVAQTERRNIRIQCAAPGYAVDDQQKRIELAETPEFGDRARGGGVSVDAAR